MKEVSFLGYFCILCGDKYMEGKHPKDSIIWWQKSIPYSCPNNGIHLVRMRDCKNDLVDVEARWSE